jgi:hypothetical protein
MADGGSSSGTGGPVKPDRRSEPRLAVRPAIAISDHEIARLVQETFCAIRTVQNWARGYPTHRTTNLRLERACEKLGIARVPKGVPPAPKRRIVGAAA